MSRKGGYKIINLKGKAITTGEEITINGLYKEIDATDKACLISGAVVDNIEIDDFYMLFEKAGDHYIGITGDNKLTIGEYDTLLWEDYKPSGSATYTAGDYIQITGDVISANTGDDGLATKEELTNAKAEINRELEGKVDEEDLTKDLNSINTSINSLSTTVGEVQDVAVNNHEDITNIQAMVETASTNAANALIQVSEKQDKLVDNDSYITLYNGETNLFNIAQKVSCDVSENDYIWKFNSSVIFYKMLKPVYTDENGWNTFSYNYLMKCICNFQTKRNTAPANTDIVKVEVPKYKDEVVGFINSNNNDILVLGKVYQGFGGSYPVEIGTAYISIEDSITYFCIRTGNEDIQLPAYIQGIFTF